MVSSQKIMPQFVFISFFLCIICFARLSAALTTTQKLQLSHRHMMRQGPGEKSEENDSDEKESDDDDSDAEEDIVEKKPEAATSVHPPHPHVIDSSEGDDNDEEDSEDDSPPMLNSHHHHHGHHAPHAVGGDPLSDDERHLQVLQHNEKELKQELHFLDNKGYKLEIENDRKAVEKETTKALADMLADIRLELHHLVGPSYHDEVEDRLDQNLKEQGELKSAMAKESESEKKVHVAKLDAKESAEITKEEDKQKPSGNSPHFSVAFFSFVFGVAVVMLAAVLMRR